MAFQGKNVVITGGAGGIGYEICKDLLESDVANVAVIDIQENLEAICKLRTEHPKQLLVFIKMDVANRKGVEASYEEIMKNFGQIDIVFNVAGIFNDLDVARTIEVNIGGIINSSLAAMEHMSTEKGGRGGIIANMSSVVGLDPLFLMPVYTATKHAILGFTRCLANEYYFNKTGVKFMAFCPGATITQLFTNFTEKLIFPAMGDEAYLILDRLHKQSPTDVSKCILNAVEKGENGSIWLIENKELYPIQIARYWNAVDDKV